ncbi:MAG: hypothetical protein WCQ95_06910 [Bacteroidota bacterium]
MEKTKRFLLVIISVLLVIPVFNSCKKGAEDPSFSIYSRKHRLCSDWGFSYYKRAEQHNDTTVTYEFDGAAGTYIQVAANKSIISAGTMNISFHKDGTYIWDEYISNDTSTYSYKEEGSWYFTGGGTDSDTHYKELLTLQQNKITQTLQVGGITTTTNYLGTGNLQSTVFKIIKLASDAVKLKSVAQTENIYGTSGTSNLYILSIEINLKNNL